MADDKQDLVAVRVGQTNQSALLVQQRQRRQMLIAFAILLLAVILLLLKDWHSWFASAPVPQPAAAAQLEKSIPEVTPTPAPATSLVIQPNKLAVAKSKAAVPAPAPAKETQAPSIVTSDRAVLPPLEVEVVAGSHHRPLKAGSNSVRVDMQSETAEPQVASSDSPATPVQPGSVVPASNTMHISANAAQIVSRPVEPDYPMLAKQMKVQGSVVLQALIDRSGNIEDLHVLSGPAILSTAAMQAVKQWRFRPYYLSGEPVETQARITVNFTISTN